MRTQTMMAATGCAVAIAAGVACSALAGCGDGGGASGGLPRGAEPAKLDPADFTTQIDNPYWPMRPGSRWVYRETAPGGPAQRIVTTVTARTRRIANGVVARVISDVSTEHGALVEVTDDWYAQDKDGNVWYLGERTTEYDNGKPSSTAGSWEAGVDGAQAGVIMPASPKRGLAYRQEYYAGEAEDAATIMSADEQVQVPFGHFASVLMIREHTRLEPKVEELKFYVRNVGPALTVGISGEADRAELLRYRAGR